MLFRSRGISDLDCIFELPQGMYCKYNNYDSNGQSALLQEIKNEVLKCYSKTDIKGDGQVVVISFSDGNIELVPGLKNADGSFKYPDSHNGGSWKITNPLPEQEAAKNMYKTIDCYKFFCQLLRKWKNNVGFKFKGLLIDSLVKKFLDSIAKDSVDFCEYGDIVKELFSFLSKEDINQKYWHALGSNQQITNDDNGIFIKKAKKAYESLEELETEEELIDGYRELFGKDFANNSVRMYSQVARSEEFPEDKFNVGIRYNMTLECVISQNGFRPKKLTDFLARHWLLKVNKKLEFTVKEVDIPEYLLPKVKWYWKVRNIGEEARRRNEERGQIVRGTKTLEERTKFDGNHYVECYAVISETIVARAKIDVPINRMRGRD